MQATSTPSDRLHHRPLCNPVGRPGVAAQGDEEHAVLDPDRAALRKHAAGLAGRRQQFGVSDVLQYPVHRSAARSVSSRFPHSGTMTMSTLNSQASMVETSTVCDRHLSSRNTAPASAIVEYTLSVGPCFRSGSGQTARHAHGALPTRSRARLSGGTAFRSRPRAFVP